MLVGGETTWPQIPLKWLATITPYCPPHSLLLVVLSKRIHFRAEMAPFI